MRIIKIPPIAVHTPYLKQNQAGDELRSEFGVIQRAWGKRDCYGGEREAGVLKCAVFGGPATSRGVLCGRCRQQTDGLSGSGDEGKQRIRHRCPRPGKSG